MDGEGEAPLASDAQQRVMLVGVGGLPLVAVLAIIGGLASSLGDDETDQQSLK